MQEVILDVDRLFLEVRRDAPELLAAFCKTCGLDIKWVYIWSSRKKASFTPSAQELGQVETVTALVTPHTPTPTRNRERE